MPPLEAPGALCPPRVDVGRQDGRVAVLGALRQRRLLESLEHERLPVGALRKVARELLHLGVEAGLPLGLELRAQRADASGAEAERLPRLDRLLLLEVNALLRRRHERLAAAVAKQRQRGEVQGVLLAFWVRARHAQIGVRHARLLVPVLLHRLQLDGVLQLPARLLLRAHYREPPRARVLSVLDPRADLELVELEGGGPAGRHAVLVHPGLRHLLLLVLRRLLRDLPPEPLDVRLLAAAAVIVVGARLFLSVARPRRGERGRNALELELDSREPCALGERRPLVALPRGPRKAGLDVLAAALLHLGLALQPALRARHPRARALRPKAAARARAEQARLVQAGKPAEAATAAEAAAHEDVARTLHPPGGHAADRAGALQRWDAAAWTKRPLQRVVAAAASARVVGAARLDPLAQLVASVTLLVLARADVLQQHPLHLRRVELPQLLPHRLVVGVHAPETRRARDPAVGWHGHAAGGLRSSGALVAARHRWHARRRRLLVRRRPRLRRRRG
mmetsp:Transcript_19174/g.64611  ORF Transcript_19174/g.64611 Transcript_19174/m.64611 type:complete len:510 (-) Transcript_19174:847-2376(-)